MEYIKLNTRSAFEMLSTGKAFEGVLSLEVIGSIAGNASTRTRVRILDSGDWRAFRSGRLILASPDDMDSIRLGNRVGHERGSVTRSATMYGIRNNDGKTVLRCAVEEIASEADPHVGRSLIRLLPLRGYTEVFAHARKLLKAWTQTQEMSYGALILETAGLDPGSYQRKLISNVDNETTTGEALGMLCEELLNHALREVDGVITDIDTEYLHDFRIAIRRVRTLLRMFRSRIISACRQSESGVGGVVNGKESGLDLPICSNIEVFERELRAIFGVTSTVRDLDVLLEHREEYETFLPVELVSRSALLFDRIQSERAAGSAALRAKLRSPGFDELVSLWRLVARRLKATPTLQDPVKPDVDRLIRKTYRGIRRRAESLGTDSEGDAIHGVRIRFKRLRYMLEFFRSLYPPDQHARLLTAFKAAQLELGAYNDAVAHRDAVIHIVSRFEGDHSGVYSGAAAGVLIGRLDQKLDAVRSSVVASAHDLCRRRVRSAIRDLTS